MVAGIASIDAILRLAKHAPVFPCRRRDEEGFSNGRPVTYKAKSPLVDNGFFAATNEEAQIREWWRRWPDALVGVPTGQRTKLVAIDWDPDKHSDVTGEWIQTNSEALMCARVHGTMRGGKHYVYRVGVGQLYRTGTDIELGGVKRHGLDLRAEGGYIIWWPIHGGSASDNQAPFLPAGLIDERIEKPSAPRQPKPHSPVKWRHDKQNVVDALAYLDPKGRDLWRDVGMAIHLASVGSDDGFDVWHAWSSGGISGEMPDTYRGLDDCRYTWDTFKDTTANPVTLGSIFHLAKQHGWKKLEEPPADPVKPAAFSDVTSLGALMQATAEHREWFFEEILPAGAFLIVGRPKVGKSWLLFQLAICAASCQDFLGFHALGRCGVLYISSEDDIARIQSRFNRFQQTPPGGLRVMVRDDLMKRAAECARKMTFSQWLDAYLAQFPDVKFVFVDTETTCRHIWDGENGGSKERSITRKDYAEVREFDSIALKHKAFIGLVNHTGKRKNGVWFDIHELINRTNTALAGASGSIVLADPPGHDPMDTESRIRVLGIRGRDISGDHLLAVEQLPTGAFESLGVWTSYQLTDVQEHLCEALLEINEDAPGQWITTKELAQWVGKTAGAVKRAISRMQKAGVREFKGFRIEVKKSQGIKLHRIDAE
jgi:hypothetical protein